MKSTHLTDETVQAYLLDEMPDSAIAKHLAMCENCRQKLEAYRHLMADISKTVPETFSFDLTTVVMDKIMLYEKKKNKKKEFFFWGALTFLLLTIASLSIPFIPKILTVFHSKSIFATLLVIGTGLVVFLFLLVDINRQYKIKKEKIFNNNLQPIS